MIRSCQGQCKYVSGVIWRGLQGDELAGMEVGVGMLGEVPDHAINTDEQGDDKILGRHANLRVSDRNTLTMPGSHVCVKNSASTIGYLKSPEWRLPTVVV